MKICLVSFASPWHGIGGLQRAARDFAVGAVALGHTVDVISSAVPSAQHEISDEGARWFFTPEPAFRDGRPWRNARWLRSSAREFDRLVQSGGRYDVVFSESTSALGIVNAGLLRGTPLVTRFHGNTAGELLATFKRGRQAEPIRELKHAVWASAAHLRYPAHFWAFSKGLSIVPSAQQVLGTQWSHALRRGRVRVVANGVDTKLFAPREPTVAAFETGFDQCFLVGGRLGSDKGFDVAIDALTYLPNHVGLIVVGGGAEEAALKHRSEERNVAERVRFVGPVGYEDFARWLQSVDVVAIPSRRDEAAPLVLLQALASGAAVVGSRQGGISEVLGGSEAVGTLVEAGNASELAEAVGNYLGDTDARERAGAAGRALILRNFSDEQTVRGLLAVCDEAREEHISGR